MLNSSVQIRELAELLHPNALCACGHTVRRHLVRRYCQACGCGAVTGCAEVEEAIECHIADQVVALLSPKPPATAAGETLFWLNPGKQKYTFGFIGFTYNGAILPGSRYTPGATVAGPLIFGSLRVYSPSIEALDTVAQDTSWGAERRVLREYLKPRIVEPPSRKRDREIMERFFPMFVEPGCYVTWGGTPHGAIEVVDSLPAEVPQ